MGEKLGILVLGHGSKLPYNKMVVNAVAKMIGEKHRVEVRTAYLNMERPTIKEGLESFKGSGVMRIVALPVFLAHGVHTLEDIPRELGIQNGENKTTVSLDGKKVEIVYAKPLGVDYRIAELAYERVKEALL